MKRHKEQRPTEREFTDAALRFVHSDYPSERMSKMMRAMIVCGNVLNYQQVSLNTPSFTEDKDVIVREQLAEGLVPGEESLDVFARRQLIRYKRRAEER